MYNIISNNSTDYVMFINGTNIIYSVGSIIIFVLKIFIYFYYILIFFIY